MKRCYAHYQGWDQIVRKRMSTLPRSRGPSKIDWCSGLTIKKWWDPSSWDPLVPVTAWKVSKYGVFSGPYFPVFGLNTEIYSINLRIQPKYGEIRTRKSPYLDTSHTVCSYEFDSSKDKSQVTFTKPL